MEKELRIEVLSFFWDTQKNVCVRGFCITIRLSCQQTTPKPCPLPYINRKEKHKAIDEPLSLNYSKDKITLAKSI
jgi:hypothetical protein